MRFRRIVVFVVVAFVTDKVTVHDAQSDRKYRRLRYS